MAVFLLLTVLYQFGGPLSSRIDRFDKIGILPKWSFFAPVPGVDDRRILYRDVLQDGTKAEWIEIDLFLKSKKNIEFLWNPHKHYQKGISDLIENLRFEAVKVNNNELIKLSWPYLMILKIVMAQPVPETAMTRQFVIINSHGFEASKTLSVAYLSDHHKF